MAFTAKTPTDRSLLTRLPTKIAFALVSVLFAALLCEGFSCGQEPGSSSAGTQRFDELDARYWKILSARPRKGTALERWYRHWAEAGRVEELILRVSAEAAAHPNNSQLQLLWGLLLERRGRFEEAHAALRRAAELAENDYYPHFALGSLAARRGMLDEAATALKKAGDLEPPKPQWLKIYKQLGRVQLRGGQRHEALDTWAKVAEQFPDDVQVLQELAELLAAEGQLDEAIKQWQQLINHTKNDSDSAVNAQRKIAQLEARSGRRDAAIERLDQLLNRLEPGGWLAAEVRREIEELFIVAGDRVGLIDYYSKRLESHVDDVDTMMSLATVLTQIGKSDEALTLLVDAIQRAPHRHDLRQQFIDHLATLGRFDEAIEQARQFVGTHPQVVELIQRLAALYVQAALSQSRSELLIEAGENYRKMAAVRADDPALALSAARACDTAANRADLFAPRNQGRRIDDGVSAPTGRQANQTFGDTLFKVAKELYREAVHRAPQRPQYHEHLGAFLHRRHNTTGAVAAWKQMAIGSHDTAERCLQLAEVLNRHEYRDEAIEALRRSIAHDPSRSAPRKQLIRICMSNRSYDSALDALDQLQSMAKTSAEIDEALRLRVDVLRLAQRVEQTIAQLESQLGGKSSSDEQHWLLALLLAESGQPAAARTEIKIVLARRPDDVPLLNTAATIDSKSGQWSQAIEVYQQLARLEPRRATVHLARVARIFLMHGEADHARAVAERMVAEHPSNPAGYRLLAEVLAFSGLADERLTALRRAVDVAPRDASMRQQLAELLERRGRDEEALDHYWRTFQLVDSRAEQLHLISIMVPLAQRAKEYPRLLERLRNQERQQRASSEVMLFVVEARRQAGDLRGALDELKTRLAKKGDHREALDTAVLLAQSLGDHQQAVALQQRVVRIAADRPALEKLAACCTAAGDDEGAERAWRRIVHDLDDPQAIIDVVDAEVRRGELISSKHLLAIGLEAQPDDWRLLLRAAHVAVIEGDERTAKQRFQKLWSLPEPSSVEAVVDGTQHHVTEGTDDAAIGIPAEIAKQIPQIEEFRVAARALDEIAQQRRVAELASRQAVAVEQRHGTQRQTEAYERLLRQQRAGLQRQVAVQFTMPKNIGIAKVVALCGLLDTARQQNDISSWFDEHRKTDQPRAIARLAMVAVADGQFVLGQQILRDLTERNPESPLPRVLQLLADQDHTQLAKLSAAQRDRALADARKNFSWIQEHRPTWAKQLRPLYWSAMLGMRADERVGAELRDAINGASELDELPGLSTLATRVGNLVLQQQVFEQAVRLPLEADDPYATSEVLRRILEQNFLYSDDEQYVAAMIAVMDRYLRETQPARIRAESSVARRVIGNTADATNRFPEPTPYFEEQRLSVLSRVYKHCALSSREFAFQDFLQRRAAECHGIDRHCYLLASAYAQWWSGELGTAIDTLQKLCNDAPTEAPLRMILVQAYKADGSPNLALEELDRLLDHTVVMGYNVQRLRRELIVAIAEDDD